MDIARCAWRVAAAVCMPHAGDVPRNVEIARFGRPRRTALVLKSKSQGEYDVGSGLISKVLSSLPGTAANSLSSVTGLLRFM